MFEEQSPLKDEKTFEQVEQEILPVGEGIQDSYEEQDRSEDF